MINGLESIPPEAYRFPLGDALRDSYMGDMPWLSVPYEGKIRGTAAQLLGVTALPTLLVFDEKQELITANGRAEIIKDQHGDNFPWYPKVLSQVVLIDHDSTFHVVSLSGGKRFVAIGIAG